MQTLQVTEDLQELYFLRQHLHDQSAVLTGQDLWDSDGSTFIPRDIYTLRGHGAMFIDN